MAIQRTADCAFECAWSNTFEDVLRHFKSEEALQQARDELLYKKNVHDPMYERLLTRYESLDEIIDLCKHKFKPICLIAAACGQRWDIFCELMAIALSAQG